jgi:hypothetical protein
MQRKRRDGSVEDKLQQIREAIEDIDTSQDTAKAALVQFISSNFVRLANSPSADTKSLLMLVAALTIISSADDGQSLGAAKRLATAAFKPMKAKPAKA